MQTRATPISPMRARRFMLALPVAAMALTACAADSITIKARHGNLPDPERLAEIVPGEINREEVAEILGSPSTIAAFDEETWLYISQQTETLAFLPLEITDQKIVVIKFDKEGVVSEVKQLGLEASQDVKPVERTTPTHGNEFTVLDQLLGNFGRFKSPGQ